MILDIFDSNFKRIGNMKKFEMVQYTDPFNSKGSFAISFGSNDDAKKLLNEGKYILFEAEVMGEIQYIESNSDTSDNIKVKGSLLKNKLYTRCIPTTFYKYAVVTEYVRSLVDNECINPTNELRILPKLVLSENEEYVPVDGLDKKNFVETGGEVGVAIEKKLGDFSMGYDCVPVIQNVNRSNEHETNVSSIEFRVLKGKDRSRFSTTLLEGEPVVEFSMDLKNLLSSKYIKNASDYKNIAYVAGEGEAEDRIVKESGDTLASGYDRIEMYVDARDLGQKELTDSEYENVLIQRGSEKLAERKISETFTAEIDQYNSKYIYGKDYKKGDWVSIQDNVLPIIVKAQVSKVIKTLDSNGESLEIVFGTEKMTIFKKIERGGML